MTSAAVVFRVPGTPRPQPRHRAYARRMGDRHVARVYDPGTASAWKRAVALAARPHRPPRPIDDPIVVDVLFLFPRPRRLQRRKDPDGRIPHVSRPDRDNLDKAVLDALQDDGWFSDDSIVCAGTIEKCYAAKEEGPGAWVRISPWSEKNPRFSTWPNGPKSSQVEV